MQTGTKRGVVLAMVLTAVLLALAVPLLGTAQHSALAVALQAVAVVPALIIAAAAIAGGANDRRVDRVLSFHEQLNSGDIQAARIRLAHHLRRHGSSGGKIRRVSRGELRTDPVLSRYDTWPDHSPLMDVNQVLWFFERVNAARLTGAVHLPLLAELVGRHAVWFDLALKDEAGQAPRRPLTELADWATEFAERHGRRYPYLRNWDTERAEDFDVDGGVATSPHRLISQRSATTTGR